MNALRFRSPKVILLGVWLIGACRSPAPDPPNTSAPSVRSETSAFTSAPDSPVRDSVVSRGRIAVQTLANEPELVPRVELRSLREQPITVESEAGNCNPPIYLRDDTRREVRWSDIAWQSRSNETACLGTGLLVSLQEGGVGAFEDRRYPVRAIRGDSLPPGSYVIEIGAVVRELDQNSVSRADTIRVPAGRVWLP